MQTLRNAPNNCARSLSEVGECTARWFQARRGEAFSGLRQGVVAEEMVAMAQQAAALHSQCCCSTSSLAAPRHARKRLSTTGLLSLGFASVSHESRRYSQLVRASGASDKNPKPRSQGRETKLFSTIAPILPLLATVVVTKTTGLYNEGAVFIDTYNDWVMPEKMIKDLYMLISMAFCWGCCVFGSMTDPFYESDEYRDAGGNGTNHWIYDMEEMQEEEAREELFREALVKEIEGKVGEVRELEGADKEKELV